jgi:hypothetical protein
MRELNHVSGIGRVAIGQQRIASKREQRACDESCAADPLPTVD